MNCETSGKRKDLKEAEGASFKKKHGKNQQGIFQKDGQVAV